MTEKIEKLIEGLSSHYGTSFQCKEVNYYGHDFYHVGSKEGFSLVLWGKNVNGAREDLVLGSFEVYKPGNGLGKKTIKTLKDYALSSGFSRIVANKTDFPEFFEKRGFMQDDVFPQDYYLPLYKKL